MIRIEDVTLAPGGDVLLEGARWHVRPGERAGLVGRNGTGKSTLLRAMVGVQPPAEGQVHRRANLRLGYLPQQAVSGSSKTVWEEARSQMDRLRALKTAWQQAEADAARNKPGAAERLGRALEAFRLAGGFAEEETIGGVLHGLGFSPDDWHRSCETFSGGWQMRIALARLLLSEPDVALLDEPTNHLDLLARSWLADHLARAPFATVIVSHDRYLLDKVATNIIELRSRRLHVYAGNFSAFLKERALRIEQHQATYDRQQEEIARLERFVTRFKAKATKAAQARSRQKQLDKMERLAAPEHLRLPQFSLPDAPASDFEVLTLKDADVGWPDQAPLLHGVSFIIARGQRVALLGPNGAGKSTLLRAVAGTLRLHGGRRRQGDRVRIGVFTQDLAADLPPEETALDYVISTAPARSPEKIRATLGALGLSGDAALRPIKQLSGGEKARVALAALTARPNNFLLLDEPTNHLDTETVEVLVRALSSFEGAMVLVTHDRYLVESLATHVMRIQDGTVDFHPGVRPTDLELKPAESSVDDGPAEGAESYAEQKRKQRERARMKKRFDEIEDHIAAAEAAIEATDAAMCSPDADFAALGQQRTEQVAQLEALMEEWETLGEQLEDG